TLSGNPVAVAAGLATLRLSQAPGFYQRTAARLTAMLEGLRAVAARRNVPVQFSQAGTMWGYYFTDTPVTDWTSAQRQDDARWRSFVTAMYRAGIYLAPSPYEAAFFSGAHTQGHVAKTVAAFDVGMD
ncbi:MAG: aspartate aminotransferase family protein, partial [Planctomycetes bacterium]|nr:aspartate aminotransferase family protein [Planctomycetota bacterium]